MVVALRGHLGHHACLLQQVGDDIAALDGELVGEVDFHVLAKTATVVVSHSLGVPETLQQRVAVQDLALDRHTGPRSSGAGHGGEVGQHFLGGLRLARATLSGDEDTLVQVVLHHCVQCHRPNTKYMRLAGPIGFDIYAHGAHDLVSVYVHALVGVQRDENIAHKRINMIAFITLFDLMQDDALIEDLHLRQVITYHLYALSHHDVIVGNVTGDFERLPTVVSLHGDGCFVAGYNLGSHPGHLLVRDPHCQL
mmetsp:Transcript_2056/g.3910  ORF Transcript_2056/g.3910 Transcript_2056/m.3910 type:complete len:252 (+) Transcript_2056:347-1102(+)